MFKVQIKKNRAFLLLAVFAVFLGIVIFHPLSHSLHHDGDDGHDCPICLWLHYAAEGSFFAVVFYAIFSVISFIPALPRIPLVKILFSANISRAPPLS
jgi:hypothetical protein